MPGGRHHASGSSFDRLEFRCWYSFFASGRKSISTGTFISLLERAAMASLPARLGFTPGFQTPVALPKSGCPSGRRGVGLAVGNLDLFFPRAVGGTPPWP